MASSAVKLVALTLGNLLTKEVGRLYYVKTKIESLNTELEWMHSYLADVECPVKKSTTNNPEVTEIVDKAIAKVLGKDVENPIASIDEQTIASIMGKAAAEVKEVVEIDDKDGASQQSIIEIEDKGDGSQKEEHIELRRSCREHKLSIFLKSPYDVKKIYDDKPPDQRKGSMITPKEHKFLYGLAYSEDRS